MKNEKINYTYQTNSINFGGYAFAHFRMPIKVMDGNVLGLHQQFLLFQVANDDMISIVVCRCELYAVLRQHTAFLS